MIVAKTFHAKSERFVVTKIPAKQFKVALDRMIFPG